MAEREHSTARVYRILIVDDEPDVTELLGYKLEQEGYCCEVLNDPLKFVGCARSFEPDLIHEACRLAFTASLLNCRI